MKYILLIPLLFCAFALQAQNPVDAVAYYPMDGSAVDATKNKNDGSMIGNVQTATDRWGNPCGALKFDGTSGYITVPSSPSLNRPQNAFSVTVWVKMETNPLKPDRKWLTVCCKSNIADETVNSPHFRVQSMQDDSRGYNTVSINTDFTEPANENLLLGKWFFYALRYDGQQVSAYIDGQSVFTFAYSKPLTPNDMPLEIGRDMPGGLEFFCGTMDDLRIFDRALTAAEITSIYIDKSGKAATPTVNIVCPDDIEQTLPSGQCEAIVTYDTPTANVDCGTATVQLLSGLASGANFPIGASTVTYKATSAAGNTATCSFVVRVTDNSDGPTIQCPPSISVNCDPGACTAVVQYPDATSPATCATPDLSRVQGAKSGSAFPKGQSKIVYRATDAAGKTAECNFNIAVKDKEKPTIDCPADISVSASAGAEGMAVTFDPPKIADNCPGAILSYTGGGDSGDQFPIGASTVTYQVKDAAGNSATCSFQVEVTETEVEKELGIQCPQDIVVAADAGECSAAVLYKQATLTGNLPDAKITLTSGSKSGSKFPVGTQTLQYSAMHPSGKKADCSFKITVKDKEKPSITCPEDISVQADAGAEGMAVTFEEPSFADNCPGAILSHTGGGDSGDQFPIGASTVTFQVKDAAGNSTTCSFQVEVMVTEVEKELGIQCPQDIVVAADAGECSAAVLYKQATLTGNLPDAKITLTSGSKSGSKFPVGTQTLQFTATHPSGKRAECSFQITVKDKEKPTITCPEDISVQTDAGVEGMAVTFDEPSFADNCPNPKLSRTGGLESGAIFPIGTMTVAYQAKDAAGNTASCTFNVELTAAEETTIEPKELGIQCPPDMVVPADPGDCSAAVGFKQATLTGNLPDAVIAQTKGPMSGSRFPTGTQTITYSAAHSSGKRADCSFKVTVKDMEDPTLTCPEDARVQANRNAKGAAYDFESPKFADNCPNPVLTRTGGLAGGSVFPIGTNRISYIVEDGAGNTATCSFVVEVTQTEDKLPTKIGNDTVVFHSDAIQVKSDKIRIYFYDNHDQDGDTISLNYDGKWMADHAKILGKKKVLEHNHYIDVVVEPNVMHYLVSKAWNEGKKPTNTLTIEIIDGVSPAKILDLTSNIGKSSAIKIFYKK